MTRTLSPPCHLMMVRTLMVTLTLTIQTPGNIYIYFIFVLRCLCLTIIILPLSQGGAPTRRDFPMPSLHRPGAQIKPLHDKSLHSII